MQTLLPFEKMQREVLVRRPAKADPKFGCAPSERSVEALLSCGVINLNKPKGPTSHQVADYVQKIFHIKKSGHSGTLDPNVTGILPVTLGKGTKVVEALLHAGKEYVCIMHLHKDVNEQTLNKVLQDFLGKIKQLPPLKSAIKRQWRYRKVYYIEVIEKDGQDVLFKIGCQAGTYIRKICHDIGQALGTGAHMAELIRTKAGPFHFDEKTCTLQDLEDALYYHQEEKNEKFIRKIIQPVENVVAHLPKIRIFDQAVDAVSHGSDLKVPGIAMLDSEMQIDEMAAVFTLKDELVALGEVKMISKDILAAEKGLAVKITKVIMEPGNYPKWRRE